MPIRDGVHKLRISHHRMTLTGLRRVTLVEIVVVGVQCPAPESVPAVPAAGGGAGAVAGHNVVLEGGVAVPASLHEELAPDADIIHHHAVLAARHTYQARRGRLAARLIDDDIVIGHAVIAFDARRGIKQPFRTGRAAQAHAYGSPL